MLFTGAFGVVEADVLGVWVAFAIGRSECLQWGGMWGSGHLGEAELLISISRQKHWKVLFVARLKDDVERVTWSFWEYLFCTEIYEHIPIFDFVPQLQARQNLNILQHHNGWKVYCLVAIKVKKCIPVSKLQSTVMLMLPVSSLFCSARYLLVSTSSWFQQEQSICLSAFID